MTVWGLRVSEGCVHDAAGPGPGRDARQGRVGREFSRARGEREDLKVKEPRAPGRLACGITVNLSGRPWPASGTPYWEVLT